MNARKVGIAATLGLVLPMLFAASWHSGPVVGDDSTVTVTGGVVAVTSGGIGTTQIATDGVGSDEIAEGAVGASELAATAVTPGSYTATNLTVDADGRVTSAANGSAGDVGLGATSDVTFDRVTVGNGRTYDVTLDSNPAATANTSYILPQDDGDSGEVLQTDGSGGLTWETASGGQTLYDAVVCASGCDYTSVATALSTEAAGSSIFVANETFNESSLITVGAATHVHFNNSTLNFSSNGRLLFSGANAVCTGAATLTGVNTAADSGSFGVWTADGFSGGCRLWGKPSTITAAVGNWPNVFQIGANGGEYNLAVSNLVTTEAGKYPQAILLGGTWNRLIARVDTVTAADSNAYGVRIATDADDYNTVWAQVKAVTTVSGNGGQGVSINDADFIQLTGIAQGCDGYDYIASGTTGVDPDAFIDAP